MIHESNVCCLRCGQPITQFEHAPQVEPKAEVTASKELLMAASLELESIAFDAAMAFDVEIIAKLIQLAATLDEAAQKAA